MSALVLQARGDLAFARYSPDHKPPTSKNRMIGRLVSALPFPTKSRPNRFTAAEPSECVQRPTYIDICTCMYSVPPLLVLQSLGTHGCKKRLGRASGGVGAFKYSTEYGEIGEARSEVYSGWYRVMKCQLRTMVYFFYTAWFITYSTCL